MRGPKPKPAAVKRQRASSRRPIVDEQLPAKAEASAGGLAAPTWVKGIALEIWKLRTPVLRAARLLSAPDVNAFARYCVNHARWLEMQAKLDADGMTYSIETASGLVIRPRPEYLIADRLERQLLAAEDRFGLNPAERQRIFAARSSSGVSGDLFDSEPGSPREGDPAAKAAEPASPIDGPIGMLQ